MHFQYRFSSMGKRVEVINVMSSIARDFIGLHFSVSFLPKEQLEVINLESSLNFRFTDRIL